VASTGDNDKKENINHSKSETKVSAIFLTFNYKLIGNIFFFVLNNVFDNIIVNELKVVFFCFLPRLNSLATAALKVKVWCLNEC
jgi:hypothetical protein